MSRSHGDTSHAQNTARSVASSQSTATHNVRPAGEVAAILVTQGKSDGAAGTKAARSAYGLPVVGIDNGRGHDFTLTVEGVDPRRIAIEMTGTCRVGLGEPLVGTVFISLAGQNQ